MLGSEMVMLIGRRQKHLSVPMRTNYVTASNFSVSFARRSTDRCLRTVFLCNVVLLENCLNIRPITIVTAKRTRIPTHRLNKITTWTNKQIDWKSLTWLMKTLIRPSSTPLFGLLLPKHLESIDRTSPRCGFSISTIYTRTSPLLQ